jgi:hypothetical protein
MAMGAMGVSTTVGAGLAGMGAEADSVGMLLAAGLNGFTSGKAESTGANGPDRSLPSPKTGRGW